MKVRNLLPTVAIGVAMLACSLISTAQVQCTSGSVTPPGSGTFPNSGGSGVFFIEATPSGCTATIDTIFVPFVEILSYTTATGAVNYAVGPNFGNARSGLILITAGNSHLQFGISQAAAPPPPEPAAPVVDMFRYYNSGNLHHFYTTNFSEQGYGGSGGWSYEGIPFHVLGSQQAGTVPLYRYYASSTHDHFYTTDFSELGNGADGYVLEEIQCYVYPTQQSGTEPLYRYRNVNTGEHFYTTNINEVGGNPNYVFEKIQAYVLP